LKYTNLASAVGVSGQNSAQVTFNLKSPTAATTH
jgi:hypothetical protein